MAQIHLDLPDWNLSRAAKIIASAALEHAGDIKGAAALMGVTPYVLKRIMRQHGIEWPRPRKSAGRRHSGHAKKG